MNIVTESGFNPATEAQQRQHEFLASPLPPSLTSHIRGNAPVSVKELPVKWLAVFRSRGNSFAHFIAEKMSVVEVDIVPSADDEKKVEGRVVVEVDVTPGVHFQAFLPFALTFSDL